jgi:hypothetical protein
MSRWADGRGLGQVRADSWQRQTAPTEGINRRHQQSALAAGRSQRLASARMTGSPDPGAPVIAGQLLAVPNPNRRSFVPIAWRIRRQPWGHHAPRRFPWPFSRTRSRLPSAACIAHTTPSPRQALASSRPPAKFTCATTSAPRVSTVGARSSRPRLTPEASSAGSADGMQRRPASSKPPPLTWPGPA